VLVARQNFEVNADGPVGNQLHFVAALVDLGAYVLGGKERLGLDVKELDFAAVCDELACFPLD